MKLKYCKKCLNVNTRPNTFFTEDGLCPPCNYLSNSDVIDVDWDKREFVKQEIISFGKANNQSGYDCIIGVSGGKDSTRQAKFVRDNLGLNPLLVSLNYPPEQISQRGVDNLSNLISLGFDCISVTCSPQKWKKLMKYAFFTFGNWGKATELALFSSVPKMAVTYQIPLVWWGENPALLVGDMGVMGENEYDGNKLKHTNTLQGGNYQWLLDVGFTKKDILQHIYPSDVEMDKANLRIVYLDYFMKEFSQYENGNYAALRGLHVRESNPILNAEFFGTSALDEDFININMMMRYLKFGWGRTSDSVNEEIRYGRMTREQAIPLVEKYDRSYDPQVVKKFSEYIGISVDEFWQNVERFINFDLFEKKEKGKYIPKFKVGENL